MSNDLYLHEGVSPNVKLILPRMYRDINQDLENIYTKIHENNIIEISIKDFSSFNNEMNIAFQDYYSFFEEQDYLEDVSITGVSSNLDLGAGSTRFSTISNNLASILDNIISYSGALKALNQSESYFKVAEYFRFMRYSNGGQHYPHYDSDFIFKNDPQYITKYSLVVYHNRCKDGELYFCNDSRRLVNDSELTTDWDRQATEDEIYLKIKSDNIKIVLFPHTLCHGVLPFTGQERNIIRGDLIFKV